MISDKLNYCLQRDPQTIKLWGKLSYTHVPISKVRRNSFTDITNWYEQLANSAYRKIEEWEKLHNFSHSCQPGCTYCCKHPILVSKLETFIISRYLFDNGLDKFIERAIITAEHIEDNLPPLPISTDDRLVQKYREQYFKANIPCPFIHDKKCVIYPVRPLSCVTYFSYGTPLECSNSGSPQLGAQFIAIEHWMTQEMINFYNYNKKAFPSNLLPSGFALLPLAIRDFGV